MTPPPYEQPAEHGEDTFEPVHPTVEIWVALLFAPAYTRTGRAKWCQVWWEHPEAIVRLDALHRSWEKAFARADDDPDAMSDWLTRYLDVIYGQLTDAEGPFAACTGTRHAEPIVWPVEAGPDELHDLELWLTETFTTTFARPGRTKWCREWFRHPEAIVRLSALWQSWENALTHASDDLDAMADWLTRYLDPIQAQLCSPEGPFAACTPDRHAPPDVWPIQPAPDGYWDLDPVPGDTVDPTALALADTRSPP